MWKEAGSSIKIDFILSLCSSVMSILRLHTIMLNLHKETILGSSHGQSRASRPPTGLRTWPARSTGCVLRAAAHRAVLPSLPTWFTALAARVRSEPIVPKDDAHRAAEG